MRFLCAAFCAAFFASAAHAAVLKEGKDWRYCSQDAHCVLIDGVCDKTSVNWQVKSKAEAFYKQQRKTAKCVERFWRPKEQTFRCSELTHACETIPKQAADADKK